MCQKTNKQKKHVLHEQNAAAVFVAVFYNSEKSDISYRLAWKAFVFCGQGLFLLWPIKPCQRFPTKDKQLLELKQK